MKKAYIYKMKLVPANVLGILIFIGMVFVTIPFMHDFSIEMNPFLLLIVFLFYLLFHEFWHGVGFFIGGVKRENIQYGIFLEKGLFYCMAYQEITKKNILISLQMPFIVLGVIPYIVGLFFSIPLLVVLAIINIVGASMDLVMFFYILSLNKEVTYSESGEPDQFVLISQESLSPCQNWFLEIVETKKYHEKDYIFSNIKKFQITKSSFWILLFLFLLGIVSSL